jgi:ATP-dependent Clp protease ATP-binding subunit ClpB
MRFEKFTNRLQQALSDAQSLAMGKDHTSIAGIHILSTLLEEPANLSLLQQAGARLPELKQKLEQALKMHRHYQIQQEILILILKR